MKPSRDITRLVEIMAALRDPETGCPWDLDQTFESIIPYTIEETFEVVDAIERGDRVDLREELGDLLLQVIYYARMAAEEGTFDFGDVVETVTTKMIRRHPHVFGDEDARNAGMAKGVWERIKAAEKAQRLADRKAAGLESEAPRSLLDDVPATMPSLLAAVKLQRKAGKVGFDWNDPRAVLAKIREELDEVEAELEASPKAQREEIGDVLFAMANLARHLDIDPDQALRGTNDKFRNRFRYIEEQLGKTGRAIETASLEDMEALWQEAKAKARR